MSLTSLFDIFRSWWVPIYAQLDLIDPIFLQKKIMDIPHTVVKGGGQFSEWGIPPPSCIGQSFPRQSSDSNTMLP